MRILHAINHLRFANGNVHVCVDLACEQARRGHDVAVVSAGGQYAPLLPAHKVQHVEVPFTWSTAPSLAANALRITAFARRFKPDIIHAHMMASALCGRVAAWANGATLITHLHNSFDRHATLMGVGDRVIAVSSADANAFAKHKFAKARIRTAINGPLHSARLPAERPPRISWPRPAITTLCGLHERKGLLDLLAAFEIAAARHTTARLNIVGDGPRRAEYEQTARASRAADRITFHGAATDPRPYLQASDIFVLASHAEPFGLVLVEARAAGCAVVATAVDGIPEALDFGAAGILVPPHAPQQLAAAILDLLGDKQRLADARRAASMNVDRFSVAAFGDRVEAIYADALGPRRSAQLMLRPA